MDETIIESTQEKKEQISLNELENALKKEIENDEKIKYEKVLAEKKLDEQYEKDEIEEERQIQEQRELRELKQAEEKKEIMQELKQEGIIEEEDERQKIVIEKQNKYETILNEQPQIKNYLEYMLIKQKVLNGQELTPEEQQFKNDMDALVAKEKEANDAQRQKEIAEAKKQEAKQKAIMIDYLETKQQNPEKVIKAREKEITLTGGESIPKLISLIFAMKKARKKGGKVLVQVFRNRKVLIKWTTNDVSFVEFYTTDEKGNELMEVTRFSEYSYSFEGSPIPVLFAVQGYAEGFDFFNEFRKDLSSEMVNRLVTRAFHAGYLKGAEVAQPNKKKGNMLEGLQSLTPLLVIAGMIIGGAILYQMYNDIHTMKATIDAFQAAANQANIQILK